MNKLITICKYINDLLPNALIIAFAVKVLLAPTLDFAQSSVVISLITLFGYRHYLRHTINTTVSNNLQTVQDSVDQLSARLDAIHSTTSDTVQQLSGKVETLSTLNALTARPKRPDANS